MKNIVFVPWTHAGIPCSSLPILLPNKHCHSLLYFGIVTNCLYCKNFLGSPSIIAPEYSAVLVDYLVSNVLSSHATHMQCCVIVTCSVFDHVYAASPNDGVSWVNGVIGIGCGDLMLLTFCGGFEVLME